MAHAFPQPWRGLGCCRSREARWLNTSGLSLSRKFASFPTFLHSRLHSLVSCRSSCHSPLLLAHPSPRYLTDLFTRVLILGKYQSRSGLNATRYSRVARLIPLLNHSSMHAFSASSSGSSFGSGGPCATAPKFPTLLRLTSLRLALKIPAKSRTSVQDVKITRYD